MLNLENSWCSNVSSFSLNRKFADIEAANHRLASALCFTDEQKTLSSLQSQKPAAGSPSQIGHLQDPEKCSVHLGAVGISTSGTDVSFDTHQTTGTEKKQTDSQQLWEVHSKSQPDTCTTARNNQGEGRKKKGSGNGKLVEFIPITSPEGTDHHHRAEVFHTEHCDNDSPLKSINNLSEDTQTALRNASFNQFGQNMDISPPFSPELSPLSLDSCDFSIQMFTDISTCTQAEKSIADIAGSPWADIMDLFSVGNKDSGGCLDVGAYLQSVCACQGDVGQEVGADDLRFADQSDSFTEKMCEDLHNEGDEHRYEFGYSCQGDQGLTINQTAETQSNTFQAPHASNVAQNQVHASISCHYNMSHLQTHQQPEDVSSCMLVNCEKNMCFTPFEGVAQSFSAPLHNPEHRPIPTPPQEHDWLFPDILKERSSPDC